MRIVEKRLKNRKGEIKLIPENLDDLWHLNHIIEKNDRVIALTKRIVESKDKNKLRADKEKITVKLEIQVEKVKFHKFLNCLRVTGKIISGIEDSGYHTLNITVGKEVSIVKEKWKEEQLKRIEISSKLKRPEIIVVTIEEGEATVGIVRDWGIEEIAAVRRSYGKDLGNYRKEFFGEVLRIIKNIEAPYLVLAGPGFTKNDFFSFLKEKKLNKKIIIENTSTIGTRGFVEVVKRGVLRKITGEIRLEEEVKYMEKLIEALVKGHAVCGLNEIFKAHQFGSIKTLLIADEFLKKEREKWDIDSFMREIEKTKGKIVIVSTDFEPGKRLLALGGIAAILRFKLPNDF